jgi:hypothetical protein
MASLHFIIDAPIVNQENATEAGGWLTLEVEVEGSAPIKSNAELVRAARAIAANEIPRELGDGRKAVGEFAVRQTRELDKGAEGLTHPDWPGTFVWRVAAVNEH